MKSEENEHMGSKNPSNWFAAFLRRQRGLIASPGARVKITDPETIEKVERALRNAASAAQDAHIEQMGGQLEDRDDSVEENDSD